MAVPAAAAVFDVAAFGCLWLPVAAVAGVAGVAAHNQQQEHFSLFYI